MLVVIIKERQTDLTWMFHCITASWSPGAGTSGIVKGGMYIHELERIPKDGLTCIQLKRNCGILPRSTDTTPSGRTSVRLEFRTRIRWQARTVRQSHRAEE